MERVAIGGRVAQATGAKRKRPDNPLERTRDPVPPPPAHAPPEFGPEPVQPAPGWVRRREVRAAHDAALAFEARLVRALSPDVPAGPDGGPVARLLRLLDAGLPPADLPPALLATALLVVYVEAELVDRAMHPDEFARADPDPGTDHVEADRLTIVGPDDDAGPDPRACVHPGCQGRAADGSRCQRLRAYGDRYCPQCEFLARAALRAARKARS